MGYMDKKSIEKKKGAGPLAVIIIAICVFAVIVGVWLKIRQSSEVPVDVGQQLLERNLEVDYPEGPDAVMEYYYELYKYLYSGSSDVTYTSEIIWQMRLMYTRELQVLNPYEKQKEQALEEVVQGQTSGISIISSEITDTRYDEANQTIAYVTVKEYWTGIRNVTKRYSLYLEDGKWKIHRWDNVEKE